MKWTEIKVAFTSDHREFAVELISNVFYSFGLKGVVEESPAFESTPDMQGERPSLPEQDAIIGYVAVSGSEKTVFPKKSDGLLREVRTRNSIGKRIKQDSNTITE